MASIVQRELARLPQKRPADVVTEARVFKAAKHVAEAAGVVIEPPTPPVVQLHPITGYERAGVTLLMAPMPGKKYSGLQNYWRWYKANLRHLDEQNKTANWHKGQNKKCGNYKFLMREIAKRSCADDRHEAVILRVMRDLTEVKGVSLIAPL